MAMYLIGDVQGCDAALAQLLQRIDFSPSRDTLYLLGDLVNRGPDSAGVLRRLMGYGASARCLLGNHDLHLLAVAHGVRKPGRHDTLDGVLNAPDRDGLLRWLHHQRMAMLERVGDQDLLMVHAGVLPTWTATETIALAAEVEQALQSDHATDFFRTMYGNLPNRWDSSLTGAERLRVVVNALTRMRFCTPEGEMEFAGNGGADQAPAGYLPWFDVPQRQSAGVTVAFGHWSTVGWLGRSDALALDTGCVWGGCLSALRVEAGQPGTPWRSELLQVHCEQSQVPGD
jgi:bis(5'-nucleosyl)-tetraphosphatase (symmetrical)